MIILGAFALSLLLVLRQGRGAGYRLLVEQRSGEAGLDLQSLMALLEREGIPWRSSVGSDGSVKIEVEGERAYRRALLLADENGFELGPGSSFDWLYPGHSLTDTSTKFQARLDESKQREVERIICWNPRIVAANLVLQRQKKPIFAGRDERPDSATVAVKLKRHVERLSRHEARSICDVVSKAFDVPAEHLSLTDDRGYSYPTSGTFSDDSERRGADESEIEATIQALYSGVYKPTELEVAARIFTSGRSEEVESVEYDREKSFSRPWRFLHERGQAAENGESSPADSLEVTEEEPVFSSTHKKTSIPAGETQAVGITVLLDLQAVRRVLRKRSEVLGGGGAGAASRLSRQIDPGQVEAYRKEQEKFLEGLFPMQGVRVTVAVEPFSEVAAALPELTAPQPVGELARGDSNLLLLGTILVVGLFGLVVLLYLRQRGSTAAEGVHSEGPGAACASRDAGEALPACADTLEAASRASRVVRERPEVAVSIMRLWLSQEDGATTELGEARRDRGRDPAASAPEGEEFQQEVEFLETV